MSLAYRDGCNRRRTLTPEALIDTPGPLAIVTLLAPALALAVSWSIELWRRALIARAEQLARRTSELERRLRDAHGELGHWERRATWAASALMDVSAALPWDIVKAERCIARLADDLRTALADNATRTLSVVPSRSTSSRGRSWYPPAMPHERSA